MKLTRRTIGLLLAALMLFGCVPTFAANGAAPEKPAETEKLPAEDNVADLTAKIEKPEAERGDVYYDPIYRISFTEAANPAYALNMVEVTADDSGWLVTYDDDLERAVVAANIPSTAGSYERAFHTDVLEYDLSSTWPSVFMRVKIEMGGNLQVVCVDEDTGDVWNAVAYDIPSDEYGQWAQRAFAIKNNAPSSGVIRFRVYVDYTVTVQSSKGGDVELPGCSVTNLQIGDLYKEDEMGNAPDSDLDLFIFSYNDGYAAPWAGGMDDHGFIYMYRYGNNDDDCYSGVYARVTAAAGDVLSFDYISKLDYMAGSQFSFGIGQNIESFQALYTGYDEGGDGYYDHDDPYALNYPEWASWSYTIPADGEYDFVWLFESCDSGYSEAFVSNIRLTPRMSPERALNDFGANITYHNGDDTPWVPCYFRNEFCMKSGPIDHNGTSTLITDGIMLKEDDLFQIRIWCSSEESCDYFRAYRLNTSDPNAVEELMYEDSGDYTDTGWIATGFWVDTPGIYVFRFEYSKDYSVSDYDDCAYLDFVDCTNMTQTHAFCATEDDEESIHAWDYYPENYYQFLPILFNGEVVLASNNNGVHNSSAYLNIDVELDAYETFTFDYIKDAEANYDNLTIYVDSSEYAVIKPRTTTWQEFSYTATEEGTYRFELVFHKDNSVHTGTDTVYLRNARVIPDGLNEALQEDYQGEDYLYHANTWAWFTPMEVDGRYAVGYEMDDPDNEAEVGVYMDKYVYGFKYITFEYKLVEDAYISLYINNEYIDEEFTADGQWHRYYYRVPQTETIAFRLTALVNGGSAAYLDNFYVGYFGEEIEDCVATGGTPIDYDADNSYGFNGYYDPLFRLQYYAAGRAPEGEAAVLAWDQYLAAGDGTKIVFGFLDEDEEANGSTFEIWLDGIKLYGFEDSDMYPNRFYYLNGFYAPFTGIHHFEARYYSQSDTPGDAFVIAQSVVLPVEATLDEALNVEGGALHFEEGDGWGGLIPHEYDDRLVGLPAGRVYPHDALEYEFGFESSYDLYYWDFIDSDGDGYNWTRYNANGNNVCVDAHTGEYVLKSASYEPGVYGLTPDNWALAPEVTIPEDTMDTELLFWFSGTNNSWYKEHFGIYVVTGTSIETAELLYDLTISEPGWNSIATSLDAYAGQTIRLAIRHYESDDVYWLFIDDLRIVSFPVAAASVSFDVDVHNGDQLCYELMLPEEDQTYYSNLFIEVDSELHGTLTYIWAGDLYENYGPGEWVPCCITMTYSGEDTITFRFILRNYDFDPDEQQMLYIFLDNVEMWRDDTLLLGDVNCDGEVTFADVGALYNFLIGGSSLSYNGWLNADVNGDDEVTFADVSALYNYIIGGSV